MLQRTAAQAIVRLYDPENVSVAANPGFMSYDTVARNRSMYISREGFGELTFGPDGVNESNRSIGIDSWTLVPGLNGLILRPYIVATDSNFSVFDSSGNYNDYYSDNDPWGHYYEFNNANQGYIRLYSLEDNKGGSGTPTIGGTPCFAARIRKYEAASGAETSTLNMRGAYTSIRFGGIWEIRIPYSGTSMLFKNGKEVMGLSYIPDSRSAVDAVDLLVMNLSGKIVISSDWLASADLYEEATPIKMSPQSMILANYGARTQVAARKVRFVSSGWILLEKNFRSYLRITDPSLLIEELSDNSYIKVDNGDGVIRAQKGVGFEIYSYPGGKTYAMYRATGGWKTPVLYGFMLKIRPNVVVRTDTSTDISSDTFHVELDCPQEEENTKATIAMKSIGRVTTVSGREKYKYADIKNLYPYMYASVILGFNTLNTDTGVSEFVPQRTFNGITKDISLTQDGKLDCSISTAIVQLQETTCDGNWGPYDGVWAIEAAENVCWECGIPPSNTGVPGIHGGFWVKGYTYNAASPGYLPNMQTKWFTVDQALADPYMREILTQLSIGSEKESKWKPRPGDNGWSVLQSIAAYENALLYVDGLNVIYDPFYNSEIGFTLQKVYVGGGVHEDQLVPTGYNYVVDHVDNFSARDQYDTYKQAAPIDTQLVSDRLTKSIVVIGQRIAGGSKQALLAAAVNHYDSGKNIPFPKRITMVLPHVDSIGPLLTTLARLANRLFYVPRDFNLVIPGHANLKARDIIGYQDHNLEGSLDTGSPGGEMTPPCPKALIKLTGTNHVWESSGDSMAWGKTTLQGIHFGVVGGLAYEVLE